MTTPAPQLSLHTPVGDLTLSEDDGAIVAVDWGWALVRAGEPAHRDGRGE